MKFYLETASGLSVNKVEGFELKNESYQVRANPSAPLETKEAFTTEITTIDELLKFVNLMAGGEVVVEWQEKFPPMPPRQHIPTLRIVDGYL